MERSRTATQRMYRLVAAQQASQIAMRLTCEKERSDTQVGRRRIIDLYTCGAHGAIWQEDQVSVYEAAIIQIAEASNVSKAGRRINKDGNLHACLRSVKSSLVAIRSKSKQKARTGRV